MAKGERTAATSARQARLIVAGLACASVAAGVILNWPYLTRRAHRPPQVAVVKAARQILAGQSLGGADVQEGYVPADMLPANRRTDVVLAEELSKALGKPLACTVLAGQTIRWSFLVGGRIEPVRAGYESVVLRVNRRHLLPPPPSGSIVYVNLLATLLLPDGRITTVNVIERVQLRSVGEGVVEVEAPAEDADNLRRFNQLCDDIDVVVRNPADPVKLEGFNPELAAAVTTAPAATPVPGPADATTEPVGDPAFPFP